MGRLYGRLYLLEVRDKNKKILELLTSIKADGRLGHRILVRKQDFPKLSDEVKKFCGENGIKISPTELSKNRIIIEEEI